VRWVAVGLQVDAQVKNAIKQPDDQDKNHYEWSEDYGQPDEQVDSGAEEGAEYSGGIVESV